MEIQLKEAKAIGSQVGVGKRMCKWVKKRGPGGESQDAFTSPTMEVSTFDSTLANQSTPFSLIGSRISMGSMLNQSESSLGHSTCCVWLEEFSFCWGC